MSGSLGVNDDVVEIGEVGGEISSQLSSEMASVCIATEKVDSGGTRFQSLIHRWI